MRALKITFIVLGIVVVLIFIAFGVFLLRNRQGAVTPFEVNTPEAPAKVLIASQGSEFKEAVVGGLTRHFEDRPVYLRVIDVSGLASIQEQDWDGLLLIHTTERSRLQSDVKKYLDRAQDLDKVVLLTTSGSGEWATDRYDVDVITSASKRSETMPVIDLLAQKLDNMLGLNRREGKETTPPPTE